MDLLRHGPLLVEQVEPFRGGALPARPGAQPDRFAAARRPIAVGPARALRLDVTEAARSAADRRDRRLHLLLRASGGDAAPLAFASPDHVDPAARPRLELLLH